MDNIYRLDDYIDKKLTYKQITIILEIPYYKGGNGKKKQLDEIQRYYELEKIGTKYLIVDSIPEQLMERGGSSSTYYNDLEIIVLYALYKHRKNATILSTNKALNVYAFVNKNYIAGYRDTSKAADILDIDNEYIDDFYSSTKRRFKQILNNALDKMQNKRLIDYSKIKMIATYNQVDDSYIYCEATDKQTSKIIDIEKRVMKSLNFSDMDKLKYCGKYRKFLMLTNEIAREEMKISYYYEAYKIIKGEEAIKGEIKRIENSTSKKALNKKILESMQTSKDKTINRNLEYKKKCIDILIDDKQKINLAKLMERDDI